MSAVRFAATVMLLRPSANSSPEVYLLRRNARSAFAPGAFVFPGGTVDAQDRDADALAATLGVDARTSPELARAAIRELFEEAGILFAFDRTGAAAIAGTDDRARVHTGELSFNELLAQREWRADASGLVLFSHWITPSSEPRRYDTAFFVAAAPLGQTANADARETYDGLWISPHDALKRAQSGELHIVYPTIKHLERLAAFARVNDVIAFARSKVIATIVPEGTPESGFVMSETLENTW